MFNASGTGETKLRFSHLSANGNARFSCAASPELLEFLKIAREKKRIEVEDEIN
ncbi:hypothetical protein AAHB54_08665 [Bacillus cereus]